MPGYIVRLKAVDARGYVDSVAAGKPELHLLAPTLKDITDLVETRRAPVPFPRDIGGPPPAGPKDVDYLIAVDVPDGSVGAFVAKATLFGLDFYFNPPITTTQTPATCQLPVAPIGTASRVKDLLGVQTLQKHGMDGTGVLLAIVDLGINLPALTKALGFQPKLDSAHSFSSDLVTAPGGASESSHGNMVAFDALIVAPNATLLDINYSASPAPFQSGAEPLLDDVLEIIAVFSQLRKIHAWASTGRPGPVPMVINNSWVVSSLAGDPPPKQPGNYSDNPKHLVMQLVSAMAREGIDIVFGAGNCGPDCPSGYCSVLNQKNPIFGVASSADVLTVGAIDATRTIAGYSSRGPGRTALRRQKPDLVAWSHFAGFIPGGADTGTSAAAPVASGVIAAYRSKHPFVPKKPGRTPKELFDLLRATAEPIGPLGWDSTFGFGIIDPVAAVKADHRVQDIIHVGDEDRLVALPCGCGPAKFPNVVQHPRPVNRPVSCCPCCRPTPSYGPVLPVAIAAAGLVQNLRSTSMRPTGWQGTAWQDISLRGVAWQDIPWQDIAWQDIPWQDIAWQDIPWQDIPWQDIPWQDIPWQDIAAWQDIPWQDISHGTAAGCSGTARAACHCQPRAQSCHCQPAPVHSCHCGHSGGGCC